MGQLKLEVEDKEKFGQEFLEFIAKMIEKEIISAAQVVEYVGEKISPDSD